MNRTTFLASLGLALTPMVVIAQTVPPMTASQSSTVFETTPIPPDERLDYQLEFNDSFNTVDLADAEAEHLSDRQIATIYKIAKLSRVKFCEVLDEVIDGKSFVTIAQERGISTYDLHNVDKEEDDINAFEQAYTATGITGYPRKNRVESSIDSIKKQ